MKKTLKTIIKLSLVGMGLTYLIYNKSKNNRKEKIDFESLNYLYKKQSDSLLDFYLNKKIYQKDWDSIFNIYTNKRDSINDIYKKQRKELLKFYEKKYP